jgi:hypothetical protein
LTSAGDRKGKAKLKSDMKPSHIAPEARSRPRSPTGAVGEALRSVYDGALNEDIPPEMLDLLGKLG